MITFRHPMTARKISSLLAALAGLIITGQILFILAKGEAVCLNQGCKVVEELTAVSPLLFNTAGLLYFLVVFVGLRRAENEKNLKAVEMLLLAGLAAEGVFVSFQFFLAEVFCSYCLLILAFILLLNILGGPARIFKGGLIFLAVVLAFASLEFSPAARGSGQGALSKGTFASKICSDPTRQLYLFFSSSCPHCQAVIDALESCNSCSFHFNPVDKIKSLDFAGLTVMPSYSHEINRTLLTTLGIETIPVLIARNPDGFSVITGEKSIIGYVRQTCFQQETFPAVDAADQTSNAEKKLFDQEEEGCAVDVDCDDEK
ncbi:MAG: hypothetical protein HY885_10870 [Deltaproteobacteria bacterium]|nr:hypothetical protein [Deltaproteobacteria bacterium]